MIAAELSNIHTTTLHPSIPELSEIRFSNIIQQELERKAANKPLQGIDLSRYEALEPPAKTTPTSDEDRPEVLEAWRDTLQKAYTSTTHLSTRLTNLSLLEQFGKNAWLIGNSQLEDILRDLEKELAGLKRETEEVNKARKAAQEGSKGELIGLEETWREGMGRVIEVEVAAEGLHNEILERRRKGAQ